MSRSSHADKLRISSRNRYLSQERQVQKEKLRKIQKNVLNTFDGDSPLAVAAKPVEAKQKHGRKAETVISHRDVLQESIGRLG
ncbi:hypothetical protein V1477_001985 [Vespula maculifrons]|uniref:Uncharacterized protein n=1 Tax=Vespula maculifrons TaxID=7453 RepID=A0ABD2CYV1_VESMC